MRSHRSSGLLVFCSADAAVVVTHYFRLLMAVTTTTHIVLFPSLPWGVCGLFLGGLFVIIHPPSHNAIVSLSMLS